MFDGVVVKGPVTWLTLLRDLIVRPAELEGTGQR